MNPQKQKIKPKITDEERISLIEELIDTYMPQPNSGREPIPHLFVKDILGCNTWHMQDEIVKSVFKYKTTAVKTCNAVGKSYIAARIVLTYLTLLPGSVVVTTAPTWRQVTDVLWREIATAVKLSKYKLTTKEVRQAGLDISKDWFAVGLSTKYPENFFGYHADNILVVVDEAGGVPEPIFKGVKAITPNVNARILYIGNPTEASGTFFESFSNTNLPIKRFTISAFDTPNFTVNGIRDVDDLLKLYTAPAGIEQAVWTEEINKRLKIPYPALIHPSVVFERYWEWGTDSPAWQSLVMGEFPSQADQALIPSHLVTMAMNMYGVDDETQETYASISGWKIPDGPPEYGQDMARFGSDLNVLTPRRGGWVDKQETWSKTDLMTSATRILDHIDALDRDTRVNIDDTGNGGGTTDRLRQLSNESVENNQPVHQYRLVAYNFSSKELMTEAQQKKFHDITSMLYWNLRNQFMKKRIALHYDKDLFNELVGRRWGITPSGKIKVESKDDYKKRTGGKSPDRSDSLALAFAGGMREITKVVEHKNETPRKKPVVIGQVETTNHDVMRPQTADLQERH